MALPNPEERPIFMDEGKVICNRCVNKGKSDTEEPCCECKWLTSNMRNPNHFKEDKSNAT